MRIGLITYQIGHRKTLDVALKLLAKGRTCTLFAFPFVKREPKPCRWYQERPAQIIDFDVARFCETYGLRYKEMPGWQDEHAKEFSGVEVWLHCTAKIVPPAFIGHRIILNAHPGMLPDNRGVDAFKWSLLHDGPVGVTLHKIDETIDGGTILYRRNVPVLSNDTLETLSRRAYDFECDMLANFADHLPKLDAEWTVGSEWPISHKRIPAEVDAVLPEMFMRKRDVLMAAEG